MKLIPLTMGLSAIVDDDSFDSVSKFNWYAHKSRGGLLYACRPARGKRNGSISMHQCILMLPKCPQVDHRNGNGLDNRKENLRPSTHSQNRANARKNRNAKGSKYKGVNFHPETKKWNARIGVNYKRIHLGLFLSEEDAARAYDDAAKIYFGEFARINFPALSPATQEATKEGSKT